MCGQTDSMFYQSLLTRNAERRQCGGQLSLCGACGYVAGAGKLTLKRTHIRSGSTIGARSTVAPGASLSAATVIPPMTSSRDEDLSTRPSSGRTATRPLPSLPALLGVLLIMALQGVCAMSGLCLVVQLWKSISGAPSIDFVLTRLFHCLWKGSPLHDSAECVPALKSTLSVAAFFPAVLILAALTHLVIVALYKWGIIGSFRSTSGGSSLDSFPLFLYKRLLDSPLYRTGGVLIGSTPFMPAYMRLLGARVGSRVWVQGDLHCVEMDLLTIGDNVSIGGSCLILPRTTDTEHVRGVSVESNVDLGNHVVLLPGVVVEQYCVLGDFTVGPLNGRYNSFSVAQGPVLLRDGKDVEAGAADPVVVEDAKVVAERLRGPRTPFLTFLTFTLSYLAAIVLVTPLTLFSNMAVLSSLLLLSSYTLGIPLTLAVLPLAVAALLILSTSWLALVKLLLSRRFESNKRFYSPGHWSWQTVTLAFHVAGFGTDFLQGTPMMAWVLRMLGVRVGKGTCIMGGLRVEGDLLEVGDGAVVGEDSVLQGHTIERRDISFNKTCIGRHATMGARSSLLPGVVLEERVVVAEQSLVMKGETVAKGSFSRGVPAASVSRAAY